MMEAADTASYDAWLIDLDGTLYSPLPVKLAMALELALGGWRVVRPLSLFRKQHEALRAEGHSSPMGPYAEQIARVASATGRRREEVEAIVVEWMHRRPGRWIRLFRRRAFLAEIERFRAAGGRTALVSDYPARDKLSALEGLVVFDAVVAAGETDGVTQLKPSPDGYLAAARALGVAPGRCLVIGDRPDADGEAARRAKMDFRCVR